jgi:hypothetical protein
MHRWIRSSLLLLGLTVSLSSSSLAEIVRGPEFLVNGKRAGRQGIPDVAIAPDGHFVVVWVDGGSHGAPSNVMARIFRASGTPQTSDLRVSLSEPGFQDNPRVAMSADGGFMVVWQSKATAQAASRVYGRTFRPDGSPLGSRFLLGQGHGRAQSQPAVARTPDGRSVVAWSELTEASGQPPSDIFVRRFSARGKPRGPETLARENFGFFSYQFKPFVTVDAKGGFIVAWTYIDQYFNVFVVARSFSDSGAPLSWISVGDPYTERSERDGSVAVLRGGERVAVWEDEEADGSFEDYENSYGVRGQRLAGAGSPPGEIFRVNSTAAGIQSSPSLAPSPDGGFVVAWTSSNGQDGDGRGVFIRSFAADATPLGPEVQLNTYTPGNQSRPVVAIAPNGRGVAVWQSMRRDGDDFAVAARLLSVTPQ